MIIQCPSCRFTSSIDSSKIPKNGINARCPKCNNSFFIKKSGQLKQDNTVTDRIICPKCNYEQVKSNSCRKCGIIFSKYKEPPSPPESEAVPVDTDNHEDSPKSSIINILAILLIINSIAEIFINIQSVAWLATIPATNKVFISLHFSTIIASFFLMKRRNWSRLYLTVVMLLAITQGLFGISRHYGRTLEIHTILVTYTTLYLLILIILNSKRVAVQFHSGEGLPSNFMKWSAKQVLSHFNPSWVEFLSTFYSDIVDRFKKLTLPYQSHMLQRRGVALLMITITIVSIWYFRKENDAAQPVVDYSKVNHTFRQIALGKDFSLALRTDGRVWSWGNNVQGELGSGSTEKSIHSPTQIITLEDVVKVSAGNHHGLAVTEYGSVWTWGRNCDEFVSISDNQEELYDYYPKHIEKLDLIIDVAGGGNYSLALQDDGTVLTWGENWSGELGDYDNYKCRSTPEKVLNIPSIKAITAGRSHAVVIGNDGFAYTWGSNQTGQLGIGTISKSEGPVKVLGMRDVVGVAAGDGFTVALKEDGTVWQWGRVVSTKKRDLKASVQELPAQVSNLNDVIDISAQQSYSIALKKDGTVWKWMMDSKPRLMSTLKPVKSIAAGNRHFAAIQKDGSLLMWGANYYGQRGNGDASTSVSPRPTEVDQTTGLLELEQDLS